MALGRALKRRAVGGRISPGHGSLHAIGHPMRRITLIALVAISLAACTPADEGAETPIPGESGAPLNDDAVGPSEQQADMDD